MESLTSSAMARTMGSDMLTRGPWGRRMELKCRDSRYSRSRMKPRSGLAHPSANTCAHSTSTAPAGTLGSAAASARRAARSAAGTTRSTSSPPSGSIKELRTRGGDDEAAAAAAIGAREEGGGWRKGTKGLELRRGFDNGGGFRGRREREGQK